jgi:hypothetical protein
VPRHVAGLGAEEEPAGDRLLDRLQAVDGPAVQHVAAALAGARADVDDPAGAADHVEVVLDDEQRVARRRELVQHPHRGVTHRDVPGRGRDV